MDNNNQSASKSTSVDSTDSTTTSNSNGNFAAMENQDDDEVLLRGKGGLRLKTQPSQLDSADGNGNNEASQEFIRQFHRLSTVEQKTIQDYLRHINLFDSGTVQVNSQKDNALNLQWKKSSNPFVIPEQANTVRPVDKSKSKRDEQIEAVLEGIEFIQKQKHPRGLILNTEKVTQTPISVQQEVEGCGKLAEVLGKGNSAGEITVFKDKKSGEEMALKTVMISQFNKEEIKLWLHMGDEGLAPELFHFELKDNKLYFTMEIMTGKDLQEVIDSDMWTFSSAHLARDFSLCILHDMLDIWEGIRQKPYVHGDMHAGNLRLERSMKVKIFDFGRAKNLLTGGVDVQQTRRLIKNDIVGIIRVFCAMYSGYDFNDIFEAVKILESKNLKQLDECMIRISEEHRKELYHIMNMLFETVSKDSNPQSPSYGNTSGVSDYLRNLVGQDMTEIKKRAAVIIFPERFQDKAESEPIAECEVNDMLDGRRKDELDPIWDDPCMQEYVNNVSDIALRELERL